MGRASVLVHLSLSLSLFLVCVCVGGTQELKERTQQPEAHLKVILADLCDYDMAGENKGKYQLKAEYR